MFSHCPSLFLFFFLEIYFEAPHEKTYMLSPSFAALIRVLKNSFFHMGFQKKFPGKNKNKEWQRENMATSGIMKSFDPIK
jgi:hypothetical protein